MLRGRPLGVRLALILAGVVVLVLLGAGLVVNRAATNSLADSLSQRDQERLALAATVLDEALRVDGRGARRAIDILLRRVAQQTGGAATLMDAAGNVVARAGQLPPPNARHTIKTPIGEGGANGNLEIVVPSRDSPFLATFNRALLITGVISVAALLFAAALVSDRVTRPLRSLASAARQLGGGDLRARAEAGPDRESAELADAFNTMADRLERSEMLRRRAATDIAHDLATPATVLESQLQAMLDGVVPADAGQLERARAAAASLSGVIRQMGELAGAEAATSQRRPRTIELAKLAGDLVTALDGLLTDRSLTARVEGAAQAVADPGHIERALRNVVTNAIQHSAPGGRVAVAIRPTGDAAEVRVRDTGPGIAAEDVDHVFERFYRADRSRRNAAANGPGSGIGLTIARELLAANGGSIAVEATGPDGTTFLLRLPRATPST